LLSELWADEGFVNQQINNKKLLSYCLGSMEDEWTDILNYWKRNAIVYPTLAMMARDIFVVHVSTVSFESCFSSANRILTDKRTKLGANFFEKLVCLKDWINAEDRMQHDITLEETTHAIPTQESDTNMIISSDDDSDGACDINVENNDLWYLNDDY
jgi:hAT family C-terminal dimerisation region